jgi:hypothetical protein
MFLASQTYFLCMDPTPLFEELMVSATQKYVHLLWNPKILYRVHKKLPLDPA